MLKESGKRTSSVLTNEFSDRLACPCMPSPARLALRRLFCFPGTASRASCVHLVPSRSEFPSPAADRDNKCDSLAAGKNKTCTITNTKQVTSNGRILPTATTCADYASGNATDLTTLLSTIKGNKINNTAPGVFFYYATVRKATGEAVSFTQTVNPNPSSLPPYKVNQQQAYLYNLSCTIVAQLTISADGTTASGGGSLPAGDYILGVKFSTAAAKGSDVPSSLRDSRDLLATHTFQATVPGAGGATTTASVDTRTK